MKKLLYISLVLFVLFSSCKKNEISGYLIEGKLENSTDSFLYIVSNNQPFEVFDSIPCKKEGKFIVEGNAEQLSPVRIYSKQKGVLLTVWVKNKDKIIISGNMYYPELIKIKGNEVNDRLTDFKFLNKDLLKERITLFHKREETNKTDTLEGEFDQLNYVSKISNINYQLREKAEEFIRANPSSMASVILMQDYLMDTDNPEKIKTYLSLISGEEVRNSLLYQNMEALYEEIKKTSVGEIAPDFKVDDINHDSIALKSFRGKYLLLTFAASWCDVCDKDSEELVSIYKEFSKKGLEILTISLDENRDSWIFAAKKNGIVWNQVIDVHGWGSELVNLYNVDHIPSNFLINKKGIIIAKNEYGNNMKEILQKELEIKD